MEIKNVKRRKGKTKLISINLKITPEVSKFLKVQDISPTLVFNEAVKELMTKAKK